MNKKIWEEKKYNQIIDEIGENRYRIFEPQDSFLSILFSRLPESYRDRFRFVSLASGTATLIQPVDFVCEDFVIPSEAQVIDLRILRYSEHDGTPHLNADDNIIFPDQKGNIWKVSRNDSPDHYLKIAEYAGLQHIAQAYHLPSENEGPISKYSENGASIPIKIECREKIQNE